MIKSIKNSADKYQKKVTYLLLHLDNNKAIKQLNDLKKVQPLDSRVFYWLKDQGVLKINDSGNIVPTKSSITYEESKILVKHLRLVRANYKSKKSVKNTPYTKKAVVVAKTSNPDLTTLILDKAKEKKHDLILNVKLVVTSIEYKL